MALSITELNAVSHEHFDKTLSVIVYDSHPLWNRLKARDRIVPGGTLIQFPIRYQKLSRADAITTETQLNYARKETRTGGTLNWKEYSVDALFTFEEDIKNGPSENRIIDLMGDKSKEMGEDMADRFATDLYTSNPNGSGITDINTIISASDTYAGIATADASDWASTADTTTTKLELYGANSLAYMCNQATFGQKMPNLHITTRDLLSTFESILEPNKRYTEDEMASSGFHNVTLNGAPVVGDSYCLTGDWYGMCIDDFELAVHPDYNFKLTDWFSLEEVGHPNQAARAMTWVGELKCVQRRTQFKFTALDYTL